MENQIVFSNRKYADKRTYNSRPVFYVGQITIVTTDLNWVSRLFSSIIKIRISGLDKNNNETKSSEEPLSFAQYIEPSPGYPYLKVNRYFKIQDLIRNNPDRTVKWVVTVTLENLTLNQNESIIINFIDRAYIEERIEDWNNRIKKLYKQIEGWIKDKPGISIKKGAPASMFEELMMNFDIPAGQMETINIFNKDGITASIKPKGLWIVGANGGIDINSLKGSFVIVDHAQVFEEPQWTLYASKDNTKVPFSKTEFLKII